MSLQTKFITILLKREIRKVNKKEVPASHFVCASLFKGRLKGIKKGAASPAMIIGETLFLIMIVNVKRSLDQSE